MDKHLPIIHVQGSHYEIGKQIGEGMRLQIQHGVESAKTLIDKAYDQLQLTWDGAIIQAKKYIPFAEERYPQYVDEMKGIAEGANVSYDAIRVVNAMEAVTSDALHLTKCTSFAVNQMNTAKENVLVAHNEDWIPDVLHCFSPPQPKTSWLEFFAGPPDIRAHLGRLSADCGLC